MKQIWDYYFVVYYCDRRKGSKTECNERKYASNKTQYSFLETVNVGGLPKHEGDRNIGYKKNQRKAEIRWSPA